MAANAFHLRPVNPRNADALAGLEDAPEGVVSAPPPDLTLRVRRLSKRYVSFCLVGGIGVGVDMLALHLLSSPSLLGWNLSLSKTIAAEVALVHNFLWNERWTFRGLGREPGWRGWFRRLARFNVICAAGIGLSVLLLNFQVRVFDWNVYVANFVAIVVVSVWNFALSVRFGWGARRGRPTAEAHDNLRPQPRS